MSASQSAIEVERLRDPGADVFRAYAVRIDGETRGSLRRGERERFQLEPGSHRLSVTIDWARSPEIKVELDAGETARFECRSRGNLLTIPYWITAGRARYIALCHASERESSAPGAHADAKKVLVSGLALAVTGIATVLVIAVLLRAVFG